jgi:heme exporter protein D
LVEVSTPLSPAKVIAIPRFMLVAFAWAVPLIAMGIGVYLWHGLPGLVVFATLSGIWIAVTLARAAIRQNVQSQLEREARNQLERERDVIDR